jgi:hypothetical protein
LFSARRRAELAEGIYIQQQEEEVQKIDGVVAPAAAAVAATVEA